MKKTSNNGLRWSARIIGALMALLCFAFFAGYMVEGMNNPNTGPGIEPYNMVMFAFWGIGLIALLLAWWKEGLGGVISLISFIIFNILAALNPVEGSGYFIGLTVFMVPSVLFIICWRLDKKLLNKLQE
ncbi:MAG: hypothetical protein WCL06_10645 [Bacteroidota bacterium]